MADEMFSKKEVLDYIMSLINDASKAYNRASCQSMIAMEKASIKESTLKNLYIALSDQRIIKTYRIPDNRDNRNPRPNRNENRNENQNDRRPK